MKMPVYIDIIFMFKCKKKKKSYVYIATIISSFFLVLLFHCFRRRLLPFVLSEASSDHWNLGSPAGSFEKKNGGEICNY